MSQDWKKLRELAEAATPGPWHSRHGITTADVWPDDPTKHPGICNANMSADDDATDQEHRNAAFCAAANPQAVIALLDEVERLGQARAPESVHPSHMPTIIDVLEDEANILTGEVMSLASQRDHLREQLAAMTKTRDEACDALTSSRSFTPHELAGIANALRKVGQP